MYALFELVSQICLGLVFPLLTASRDFIFQASAERGPLNGTAVLSHSFTKVVVITVAPEENTVDHGAH